MKKEIPLQDLSDKPVLGIDEVGRGSLAGPVHVAGVMCPKDFPVFTKFTLEHDFFNQFPDFSIVRDSKKLSQINREKIAELIEKHRLQHWILQASSKMIDKYGIGVCISHMLAVIICLSKQSNPNFSTIADGQIKLLAELSSEVLKDLAKCNPQHKSEHILNALGVQTNLQSYPIYRQNYADDIYLSVALASNLAKVKRDTLMSELDKTNPEYHWAKNKGYGTLEHRRAIKNHPKNSQLRYTFLKKLFIDANINGI